MRKGQMNLISLAVVVVMTLVVTGIMIYSVFFPVTSTLNTNSTTSLTASNLTDYSITGNVGNYTQFVTLTHPTTGVGSLTLWYYAANNNGTDVVNVLVGNTSLGSLANATTNTTASFTNVTASMIGNLAKANITYSNTSINQSYEITNSTLSFTQSIFGNIPANQQGNFSTVLLLAGILVVIVGLVGILYLTKVLG